MILGVMRGLLAQLLEVGGTRPSAQSLFQPLQEQLKVCKQNPVHSALVWRSQSWLPEWLKGSLSGENDLVSWNPSACSNTCSLFALWWIYQAGYCSGIGGKEDREQGVPHSSAGMTLDSTYRYLADITVDIQLHIVSFAILQQTT